MSESTFRDTKPNRKKRLTRRGALAVVTALALAACGAESQGSSSSASSSKKAANHPKLVADANKGQQPAPSMEVQAENPVVPASSSGLGRTEAPSATAGSLQDLAKQIYQEDVQWSGTALSGETPLQAEDKRYVNSDNISQDEFDKLAQAGYLTDESYPLSSAGGESSQTTIPLDHAVSEPTHFSITIDPQKIGE